jgi:hypothetical protein
LILSGSGRYSFIEVSLKAKVVNYMGNHGCPRMLVTCPTSFR